MGSTLQTPSANTIIEAVRQLPLTELEPLVDQVLAIRAARRAPHLTADESALFARVNAGLTPDERARMNFLLARRDDETVTSAELAELISLTDRLETLHADRLAALAELAGLKGVTLDEMMNQLGIKLPDHD